MTDTINIDGYVAKISMDFEQNVLHGEVINTRDVLTFQADSVAELTPAFQATLDDYRKWCAEDGVSPEKPYSGTVSLRMPAELHREAVVRATRDGLSLNAWLIEEIQCAVGHRQARVTRSELDQRVVAVKDDLVRIVKSQVILGSDTEDMPWQIPPARIHEGAVSYSRPRH